ncbi:MAG: acyltransferase [Bacteroidales bacterium]|nr:acyltransferase [Bacteroidales bacterium]
MDSNDLENIIFNIRTDTEFNDIALEIFRFQYNSNKIYRAFVDNLEKDYRSIDHFTQIPFLPVEFFKSHKVYACPNPPVKIFESSGTTGMETSKHHIADISLYEKSFTLGFRQFYGSASDFVILALLPSYLERGNSSLVFMIDRLISESGSGVSGFYLTHTEEMLEIVNHSDQNILLVGVSFALLDLAESGMIQSHHGRLTVMETGGMKGRRSEIVREELHQRLKKGLHTSSIHSEYGMTELLSQAYSKGKGIFATPPWMKILIRDTNDPLSLTETGKTGGINIIDLANLYSCSFIATKDLGKLHQNGTFEVSGRFDNSDIRGCNLLVE